jgi:hypothetical protein
MLVHSSVPHGKNVGMGAFIEKAIEAGFPREDKGVIHRHLRKSNR